MLLSYGIGRQSSNWHVIEQKPPYYIRVYLILGGETTYIQDGFEFVLKKDYVYLFPANSTYEIRTNPEDPIECVYMHLDLQAVNMRYLIPIALRDNPEVSHLFWLLTDAIKNKYARSFVSSLAQSFEEMCKVQKLFQSTDGEMEQLLNSLRAACFEDVKISEIAKRIGYSKEYFIRNFKKHMGITPYQYILSLRMNETVRMLRSNCKLDEIAVKVGYADGHSLTNAFINYYGISPTTYQKIYTGEV